MAQRGNSILFPKHSQGTSDYFRSWILWLSMALLVRGRSFLFHCQRRTDTCTRIWGAIYTVPKPIGHNPGVSLPLIISGHGFCGYPWLSWSEGGPFSSAAREEPVAWHTSCMESFYCSSGSSTADFS